MPTKSELKRNLKALKERLTERPMDLDARMRTARTYRLLGKKSDAVAHYGAVARYLSLAGHPLQAIAVLKELLQVDPSHEETLLFLAKLYARTRAVDATNRGRVAVPILDGGPDVGAFPEGIPLTATGIWRAIRPAETASLAVVKDADEIDAHPEHSLDEGDVIEESPALPADDDDEPATAAARRGGGATSTDPEGAIDDDPFGAAPDLPGEFGEDFEILGTVSTEDLLLPQVPLFSSLSPEAFVHLGHAMVFQRAKPGAVVFREGDPGDSMVVISKGRARVWRGGAGPDPAADVELMTLGEGDFAGVFALMAGQERQANLTALTDLEYFEIDRLAVDALVRKYPAVKISLQRFFRERLLLNLLAALPVFSNLSSTERQDLARRFVDRDYEADDELFFEGAEHDGFWIVLEGAVKVGRESDAGFYEKARLVPGDYVGSLAAVDEAQADLSAVATAPTRCALLSHKMFGDLLSAHPDMAKAREAFQAAGLLVGEHVFAGNGRLPGLAKLGR